MKFRFEIPTIFGVELTQNLTILQEKHTNILI